MELLSVHDKKAYGISNFKVLGFEIDNRHTDVLFGEFVNQTLLILTQCEKVGSIVRVVKNTAISDFNISEPVFSVDVVFGIDNCEQQAAARYIAERINIVKPLVIVLNLNNYAKTTISAIISVLHIIVNSN